MAILVDPPRWPAYGLQWSHLASDTSLEELHDFAARLSIPRRGFEGDHYDVPETMYEPIVDAGAIEVSARELVAALHTAGLRLRHLVGDRPIDRVRGVLLDGGPRADVDLVISRRPVPDASAHGVAVLLRDSAGLVALERRNGGWSPPAVRVHPGETIGDAAVRSVRSRTGLRVEVDALAPVAFQVRRTSDTRAPWTERDRLAVVAATLEPHHDNSAAQSAWVDLPELERRCAGEFWWPIPAYLYEVGRWAMPSRR